MAALVLSLSDMACQLSAGCRRFFYCFCRHPVGVVDGKAPATQDAVVEYNLASTSDRHSSGGKE